MASKNVCVDCGKACDKRNRASDEKSRRCRGCAIRYRVNSVIRHYKLCIRCGKSCFIYSTLCRDCHYESKAKPRKIVITRKTRKKKPDHCCEDCGIKLSERRYKRCHACNMKHRWSDKEYKKRVTASIKDSFESRWANPVYREKIILRLTSTFGTSKLEKYVASIAEEYGFKQSEVVGTYFPDLINKKKKLIVEVNGDLWHCNPLFWRPNDIHPNKKVSAKKIWARDKKRKKYLESQGYKVYVIWENDIIQNDVVFIHAFFQNLIKRNESKRPRILDKVDTKCKR